MRSPSKSPVSQWRAGDFAIYELFAGQGLMRLLASLGMKYKEMAKVLEKVSDEKFDMILRLDLPFPHA